MSSGITGDVIKSFLVGLGFDVDDASLAKFNKAIASASIRVAALYTGIQVAAAGIFASISKMSEGFEDIGYQLRLVAPAINKMLILRQAMISAYQAAGINLTKVVQQSILFNYSLAKTKFALEAVYKSVGAKFLPLLTKQLDIFRAKIFANMPKIQAQLMTFVNFVFKAFAITVQLGSRMWEVLGNLWDLLKRLDSATNGWSTRVLGFVAVWKYLNLAFLTTPFGMVLTGLLAIIALYDDFKVWEAGGSSFINWGSDASKMVLGVVASITALVAAAGTVVGAIRLVTAAQWLWNFAMSANPIGLLIAGVTALIALFTILAAKAGFFKGLGTYVFGDLGDKVLRMFGAPGAQPMLNAATQPAPLIPPTSASNQSIDQKTSIIVQSTADAAAVGKQVAGEQSRVNFDMGRNLKGAMR